MRCNTAESLCLMLSNKNRCTDWSQKITDWFVGFGNFWTVMSESASWSLQLSEQFFVWNAEIFQVTSMACRSGRMWWEVQYIRRHWNESHSFWAWKHGTEVVWSCCDHVKQGFHKKTMDTIFTTRKVGYKCSSYISALIQRTIIREMTSLFE